MIKFDLLINEETWTEISDLEGCVERAFQAGHSVALKAGEVSLLLTDNAEMHELNKQFRSKDKPTDVLSFPADPMDAPFLGDIAIGYGISSKDAATSGKNLVDHLSHLIIHGYLHTLGYDHQTDEEAEEMETMERRALASLGIADPYSKAQIS